MAQRRRPVARTYTHDEKVALVTKINRLYRAGDISLKAAAEVAGTTSTSYRAWLKAGIRPQPPEPVRPSLCAPPPTYTADERRRLLAQIDQLRASGLNLVSACSEAGISVKSYRRWREEAAPPAAMVPVEVTALVPATPPALAIVPPRPAGDVERLTLVTPGGYRLEGLGVEAAVTLLRALPC